jgi:hypothetical protein
MSFLPRGRSEETLFDETAPIVSSPRLPRLKNKELRILIAGPPPSDAAAFRVHYVKTFLAAPRASLVPSSLALHAIAF